MSGFWLLVLLGVLASRGRDSSVPADGREKDGGRFWGTPDSSTFGGFDFAGNGIEVDDECGAVAEGRWFFPFDWATVNTRAEEADTVGGTLAIGRDNTVLGFIDYLTDTEGVTEPEVIAARILEDVAPTCASVPVDSWGPAMRAWYASLSKRVTAYVGQDFIG